MEKIKQFLNDEKGKDVLTIILVILVSLSSFGLGRLSKSTQNNSIKINYGNQSATSLNSGILEDYSDLKSININSKPSSSSLAPNTPNTTKKFFASNRGQKYYPLSCSAGKSIKQENRVYFSTPMEAEKAGYELSSSC